MLTDKKMEWIGVGGNLSDECCLNCLWGEEMKHFVSILFVESIFVILYVEGNGGFVSLSNAVIDVIWTNERMISVELEEICMN